MAKLTDDEQSLLDELTAKASAPDAEDWELEIFDGAKGARLPISKGGKWLYDNFGIGDPPAAPSAPNSGTGGDGGQDGGQGESPNAPERRSYFGKKQAGS